MDLLYYKKIMVSVAQILRVFNSESDKQSRILPDPKKAKPRAI